jgi:putative two-component system response regulator
VSDSAESRKRILVVDDNPAMLRQMGTILAGEYAVVPAKSGATAIRICARTIPDLVLLDVMMPDMDGFETMERLSRIPYLSHIPVIFLTASHDPETEIACLAMGAADFIVKPVDRDILLHRIALHLKDAEGRATLERSVMEMADSLALGCAELIEWRDGDTWGHVQRTGALVQMLGDRLMRSGLFQDELNPVSLEMIARAAPLHDIGKIAISDSVLLKPGKLTGDEYAVMKTHARVGAEILSDLYVSLPSQHYLEYARIIAGTHHERVDGKGYPDGLVGNAIPLSGRIMAVADVYDALTSDRVYRKGLGHERASSIIRKGRGTQFDAPVVDAFMAIQDRLADGIPTTPRY